MLFLVSIPSYVMAMDYNIFLSTIPQLIYKRFENMEILKYILLSSLIFVPCVFLGLFIDTFLSKQGLIRSAKGAVVLVQFFLPSLIHIWLNPFHGGYTLLWFWLHYRFLFINLNCVKVVSAVLFGGKGKMENKKVRKEIL